MLNETFSVIFKQCGIRQFVFDFAAFRTLLRMMLLEMMQGHFTGAKLTQQVQIVEICLCLILLWLTNSPSMIPPGSLTVIHLDLLWLVKRHQPMTLSRLMLRYENNQTFFLNCSISYFFRIMIRGWTLTMKSMTWWLPMVLLPWLLFRTKISKFLGWPE